jgi:hypothetical protein
MARESSSGWDRYPNLQLRPHAPNAGKGRLQRQIARAFIGHPFRSTSEIYDWCYARDRSRTRSEAMRWSVHRILREIAEPVRKVPPHGAWLWRLKTPVADIPSAPSAVALRMDNKENCHWRLSAPHSRYTIKHRARQ